MRQANLSQIIERMRRARDGLARELSAVSAEEAGRGSSWAIADVVRHLRGRPFYLNLVQRLLSGETLPALGASPESFWLRTVEQTLKDLDEAIALVEGLREEDLERSMGEGAQARTVRSLLEMGAAHYEEHLEHIRQIKAASAGRRGT